MYCHNMKQTCSMKCKMWWKFCPIKNTLKQAANSVKKMVQQRKKLF